MAGTGGKREGAGRKKSQATLRAQLFREALSKEIGKDAKEWIAAIRDLALGHYIEVVGKDGKTQRVYKKSPDARAWEKATDRAFGKATQPLSNDPDDPISIAHTISKEAKDLLKELTKHEKATKPKKVVRNFKPSTRKGQTGVDKTKPKK